MCFQWWLEAPGGMSDLSVYELEDNVWDEISASDDHIVPHPAAGHWDQFGVQGDSRKKLRLDVNSADDASRSSTQGKGETSLPTLTKNNIMLEKDSWSHTPDGVFTGLCENGSANEITSVSSQEGRMPSGCLTNGNLDTVGAEFCAEDPILGEKSNAVSDNAYRYPLSHITQTDNDLRFFNNDREDKESNDLLYYGWPDDIGNFEDVDRMFRSCDSTFGLESLGNEDDLCWFSSSRSTEASDDALKLDSKFSISEACALNSVSEHHEASGLGSLGPSVNDSGKKSSFMADNTTSRTADATEQATVSHITSLNGSDTKSVLWDKKQARNQNQSESKKKDRHVKTGTQRHKQSIGSNSVNYMQANVPYMQMDFNRSSDQISVCPSQPGPTGLYAPVSTQKQTRQSEYEIEGQSEIEGMSMGVPADLDSSNVQESCMSSVVDEISLEATSFRQLQQVMEQLDIRTKLCIRDSLYRLARSAEQRHNCGNLKGGTKDDRDRSCALIADETNKNPGFLDMETDTNPIDRSIAHLLFHRPSDPSVMPANDALSHQSPAMIHGSITSPPVMTKGQVNLEENTVGVDQNVSISDGKQ